MDEDKVIAYLDIIPKFNYESEEERERSIREADEESRKLTDWELC